MTRWHYYLAFWSRRSTATVVPALNRSQARDRAQASEADRRLIRQGVWVRRRRNGSSPQFGSAPARAAARRQRSRYRPWL
jgi:hypothetical protein